MPEEFKVLSDIEHILKRPAMYIGSCVPEETQRFISGKRQDVTCVPGLLKITNEIIDNSVDEFIRSKEKYANKVNINIDKESFTVEDNGRGIPVEKYQDEWRPKLSWCAARAGTSFSDNRESPGANGVGSMITNCFSKEFIGETYDGKKYCRVHCEDNISKIKVSISPTITKGTRVTSYPDFERFNVQGYDDIHISILKERIITIAATYNNIKFTFNNESIRFKNPKQYLDTYGEIYILTEFKNGYFGIYATEYDEYVQKSSINGLELTFGGTHENYIMREVSYALKDIIKKKHKLELAPAEIKRCLKLVFIGRSFPNMEFESQTKEKLSNSEKSVKEWLGEIDFQKLAKRIFSEQSIIEPIIQAKLAKQLAAEARAVTIAQKKMSKVKVHKHVAAKGKKNSILFLTEGDCLYENTNISVIDENGNIVQIPIKNISIGDIVITHNHKLRQVTSKTHKLKKGMNIKTKFGDIKCSKEHKLLTYNIKTEKFEFLPISMLDITIHKLVRSNLIEQLVGCSEVVLKEQSELYDIKFTTIDNDEIDSTNEHIFTCFDISTKSIVKKQAKNVNVGDFFILVKN